MFAALPFFVTLALALLTACGLAYQALCMWSARGFLRSLRRPLPAFAPGVSILKSVKGVDPEIVESFESHVRQDYAGEYELIFGVHDANDPAVPAVERLIAAFPERSIRLVVCPEVLGTNGKVSNLVQMLPCARYGHVLINDGDIRVPPRYLSNVMAPFGAPSERGREVGMVTALYRGVPGRSLGSRLESLGIATDFCAGVLVARQIERGIRFGLGSTLAISRRALEEAGGLAALLDYLADDYEMGSRIARAGYDVVLARTVVDTFLPPYTFRQFLEHQLRWARCMRDSRRGGYVGLALTFALPWALLTFLASGAALWSAALLSLTLLVRTLAAVQVGWGVLGDRHAMRSLALVPLRDAVWLCLWVASFAGDTIVWRGQRYALKDGKLLRDSEPQTA